MREKTLDQAERWLKSCLKRKTSITERTLIAFLIAGTFGFVGENLFADVTNDNGRNSIHVGTVANAGSKNILVGNVSTNGDHSLIFAEKRSVGWHGGGNYKIAFGDDVGADGSVNYGIIFGDSAAHALSGSYKFIFGNSSGFRNSGNYNFAFGQNAGRVVSGDYNFAFGYDAGQDLGTFQNASGTEVGGYNISLMQGAGNQTKGSFNTAIGFQAGEQTKGHYNFAFGSQAGKKVTGDENVAWGSHAGQNVTGRVNYALGINAGQNVAGNGNYAIGENAGQNVKGATDTNSETKGWSNVAIGKAAGNNVIGNHNYSFGENAGNYVGYRITWENGVFKNSNSPTEYIRPSETNSSQKSGAEHNIALGANAGNYIAGQDNVALGQGAGRYIDGENAGGAANTAIGLHSGNKVYGNENISVGSVAGNEINGNKNISVGSNASKKIKGNNNIAIGVSSSNTTDNLVEKTDSISLGTEANATKNNAIAIGKGAKATGESSISLGTGNEVSGNNSGAIGDPSYISGTGTYTIGNDNGTKDDPIAANNAGAFGNSNKMTTAASESRIVGNSNTVSVENAFVLGNNVTANVANSIFLGKESAAITTGDTTAGATTEYKTETINATAENGRVARTISLENFAGHTPVGVVTVGSTGKERRIQNVAAGKISATSTDAVNGSQLFALASKMTDIAGTVAANAEVTLKITGDNYDANVDAAPDVNKNKENIGKVKLSEQNLAINGTAGEISTTVTKDGQAVTISLADDIKTAITSIANKADKSEVKTYVVEAGKNTVVTPDNTTNGTVKFTVDAEKTVVVAGTGLKMESTETATKDNNYVNKYTLALSDELTTKLNTASPDTYFHVNTGNNNGGNSTTNLGKVNEAAGATALNALTAGVNAKASGTNSVAIGLNAVSQVTNGVAIGNGAGVVFEGGKGQGGIAIGEGAKAHTMGDGTFPNSIEMLFGGARPNGMQENSILMGRTPEKQGAGIAIGTNAHARKDSIDIGNRNYSGKIGDSDNLNAWDHNAGVGTTTIGSTSYNNAYFGTINGAFNIISKYITPGSNTNPTVLLDRVSKSVQGLGGTIVGTFNSIEAKDDKLSSSGLTNILLGTANRTNKSNGTVILGAGNTVTNSYVDIRADKLFNGGNIFNPLQQLPGSVKEAQDKYIKLIQDNRSGSVFVIGGGNTIDKVVFSNIQGVGNTLTGNGTDILDQNNAETALNYSAFNSINGYENKGVNVTHTALTGSWNEIVNSNKNIVTGNNHIIKGTEADKSEGNIVLGFNTNKSETNFKVSADNIVAIGNDIVATENNSVYLGNGSKNAADTATKGMETYSSDATIINGKTLNFAGGTPTGIVSVGSEGKERRIQNVASGKISATSTDAINGSQLYAVAEALKNVSTTIDGIKPVEVKAGKNVEVSSKTDDTTKVTTYTIDVEKTTVSSGDENLIKITTESDSENNITNYKIDLAKDIKDQIKGATIRETVVAGSSNLTVTDTKTNTSGGKEFTVDLAKDINLTDKGSLTIGNTVVNNNGLTINNGPSITSSGIDAAGEVISNVKAGEKDTDAVNVSQLKGVNQVINNYGDIINENSQKIADLEDSTSRGIAGAMAQAGVKFQEIGINQAVIGAAVSNYKGTSAVAAGIQLAPTENVRVHGVASAAAGKSKNSNFGVTVGASYRFNLK